MVDSLDRRRRSENMRRITSKDTKPEIVVRRVLAKLGYRYRLHRKDLPGKPDIVFPGRKKIIFVHGCFWHQHRECREGRIPGSRTEYWVPKLRGNTERDEQHQASLASLGWQVLVIWECQAPDRKALETALKRFLDS
jgi:DNA mismatch endonuclease (patch repair protein)